MTNPVHVSETVWQMELPLSPHLPDFTSGLALTLVPGERDGAPTFIAALHFRMPDSVVRRYRGRIAPAIHLVSINTASGEVYTASCLAHDYPPATFDAEATPESEIGAPMVGGFVNVDLIAQLMLPPDASQYFVFAWLDEWVSAPSMFELPADPKRRISPIRLPANEPSVIRKIANEPTSKSAVSLTLADAKLKANWNAEKPSSVVLLGYGLENRNVYWEIVTKNDAPLAKSGTVEFSPAEFVNLPASDAKAFALVAGGQISVIAPVKQ